MAVRRSRSSATPGLVCRGPSAVFSGTKSRQFNFAVDVAAPEPVELHEHDAYAWSSLTDKPPVTDAVKDILATYQGLRTESRPEIP